MNPQNSSINSPSQQVNNIDEEEEEKNNSRVEILDEESIQRIDNSQMMMGTLAQDLKQPARNINRIVQYELNNPFQKLRSTPPPNT